MMLYITEVGTSIGATMWTSLDKGKMVLDASLTMNDYHAIRKGASTLSPTDTIEEYDKSMKFMNELLPTLKDRVIVMSHHTQQDRVSIHQGQYQHIYMPMS